MLGFSFSHLNLILVALSSLVLAYRVFVAVTVAVAVSDSRVHMAWKNGESEKVDEKIVHNDKMGSSTPK